jgi:hypothetical protein
MNLKSIPFIYLSAITACFLFTNDVLAKGFGSQASASENKNNRQVDFFLDKDGLELANIRAFVEAEDTSLSALNKAFGTGFRDGKTNGSIKALPKSYVPAANWNVFLSRALEPKSDLYSSRCQSQSLITFWEAQFNEILRKRNGVYAYGQISFPLGTPTFDGVPRIFRRTNSANGDFVYDERFYQSLSGAVIGQEAYEAHHRFQSHRFLKARIDSMPGWSLVPGPKGHELLHFMESEAENNPRSIRYKLAHQVYFELQFQGKKGVWRVFDNFVSTRTAWDQNGNGRCLERVISYQPHQPASKELPGN